VREYSGVAGAVLFASSLKRTYFNVSMSAKRRSTEDVNNSLAAIAASYNDMDVSVTRPLGSNAALNVSVCGENISTRERTELGRMWIHWI
jgi:hypothetical protein